MEAKILLVDDEQEMRKLLKVCFSASPFQLDEASNGDEAFLKVQENNYDLIILDIMMPEIDGFELLNMLRVELDTEIPVILLTALGDTERVVEGLKRGADDYVVKPFEPKELVARVESVLRRSKSISTKNESFTIKGLDFHPNSYQVIYNNMPIPLTKKEFQIFLRLAKNPGRVYDREHLLELEWGLDYEGENRTVDTHVKNIREKLKAIKYDEPIIETVWGIGYKVIEDV
ncbi:response regulator transcription factor [Evansella cellulosilytica]|uniref:Two component transcriptional regulator, winged helix family n=1 Tax=Evansella cellulosilytica (strain ATCC 21833 / DSM 2522 / FERM P-1141 / JCM 9156 / N-4) TaxID=649639 RepID=E6TQV1_EVAC2|nr:response regulator transcription factor [Evansella cellulosilytica]ADU31726.1 two component transcriptional regulator, winged helix family [Evansella cellulosilytica DSM 2522]